MLRMRRPVHCSLCKQIGHNKQRCPDGCSRCNKLGHTRRRCPDRVVSTTSRSAKAAIHMKEHGLTFKEASALFQLNTAAVQRAWENLGFGATPAEIRWAHAYAELLELLRQYPIAEVLRRTSISRSMIYKIAHDEGIPIIPPAWKQRRELARAA